MGMTWTDDQRKVIELRDRNILVSAAAAAVHRFKKPESSGFGSSRFR